MPSELEDALPERHFWAPVSTHTVPSNGWVVLGPWSAWGLASERHGHTQV